jgi:hypothetical protein
LTIVDADSVSIARIKMDVRLVGVAGTEPPCARLEGDFALCMTRGSLKTTSWTSAFGHFRTLTAAEFLALEAGQQDKERELGWIV